MVGFEPGTFELLRIPEELAPGKMVPGKMIPEKWSPGKMVPGKMVRGKRSPGNSETKNRGVSVEHRGVCVECWDVINLCKPKTRQQT